MDDLLKLALGAHGGLDRWKGAGHQGCGIYHRGHLVRQEQGRLP
jgi:hypothetical protein